MSQTWCLKTCNQHSRSNFVLLRRANTNWWNFHESLMYFNVVTITKHASKQTLNSSCRRNSVSNTMNRIFNEDVRSFDEETYVSPIVSWYNIKQFCCLNEWNIDRLKLHNIFVKVSNNKISNTQWMKNLASQ